MSSNCTFDIFRARICKKSNKNAMPYKRRKISLSNNEFRIFLQLLITMGFIQLNQEKLRLYFKLNSNDVRSLTNTN